MPGSVKINPRAVALGRKGERLSRRDILEQLGLNPGTPPDAWLAIVGCGSNASALRTDELKNLVDRGVISKRSLDAANLKRIGER